MFRKPHPVGSPPGRHTGIATAPAPADDVGQCNLPIATRATRATTRGEGGARTHDDRIMRPHLRAGARSGRFPACGWTSARPSALTWHPDEHIVHLISRLCALNEKCCTASDCSTDQSEGVCAPKVAYEFLSWPIHRQQMMEGCCHESRGHPNDQ